MTTKGSPEAEVHAYTTNTLHFTIDQETQRARGTKGKKYNPDVPPYQPWVLKRQNTDPATPEFREQLLKASSLLKKHTKDRLWEIVSNGWVYDDGTEPDWDSDLEDAFIDAVSKALTVNSAFITRWRNGSYKVFTTNDVLSPVYLNKDREIAEIYFKYPILSNAVSQENENAFKNVVVGFLTQYSDEIKRKARIKRKSSNDLMYRDCVLIQPYPSIHDVFGEPYLRIECETATQKQYLRMYEFAYIHKGGIDKTIAFPEGSDKTKVKDTVMTHISRGILDGGLGLSYKGGKKGVGDLFLVSKEPIPSLGFEQVNSMISEDSELTKQKIEGSAETGALGGKAPEVNKEEDERQIDAILYICERAIRDIEYIFFEKEPYVEEKLENGRIKRTPAYRVIFNRPEEYAIEENRETMPNQPESKQGEKPPIKPEAHYINNNWGNVVEAVAHSTSAEFITYEGNMFQAGPYFYPNKGKYEVYTADDIEALTRRPVNRGYLELHHSFDVKNVNLNEGIGYWEIVGFDKKNGKDITQFHVYKDVDKKLRDEGVIVRDLLKVSPYFNHSFNPEKNRKNIAVLNVAVVDPKIERPLAELTGLKTEARRK
ncbi:MAG: hypothetical protein ACTSQ8_07930 [Candidatus Helarchaeota archaeon]